MTKAYQQIALMEWKTLSEVWKRRILAPFISGLDMFCLRHSQLRAGIVMGVVKLVHLAFDGFAVHVFVDLPADIVLVRGSQIDLLQTLVICIQTVLSVENNLIAGSDQLSDHSTGAGN